MTASQEEGYKNAEAFARLRDEQFSLYEDYARKHGINSKSLVVLMWLYHMPKGITQETIAKRTLSTKQVVGKIIRNLQAKDYVSLKPSSKDKRKKLVYLTPSGRAYAKDIILPLKEGEGRAMAQLTSKEQDLLLKLFEKYSQGVSQAFEQLTGDWYAK